MLTIIPNKSISLLLQCWCSCQFLCTLPFTVLLSHVVENWKSTKTRNLLLGCQSPCQKLVSSPIRSLEICYSPQPEIQTINTTRTNTHFLTCRSSANFVSAGQKGFVLSISTFIPGYLFFCWSYDFAISVQGEGYKQIYFQKEICKAGKTTNICLATTNFK